jgi:hypothetical protein
VGNGAAVDGVVQTCPTGRFDGVGAPLQHYRVPGMTDVITLLTQDPHTVLEWITTGRYASEEKFNWLALIQLPGRTRHEIYVIRRDVTAYATVITASGK